MSHRRLILYVGELLQSLLKVLLLEILLKISAQKTSETLAKIIENAKKNRGKNKSTFNRRAVDVEVQHLSRERIFDSSKFQAHFIRVLLTLEFLINQAME